MWLIRVTWLIRGTPGPRIHHTTRIHPVVSAHESPLTHGHQQRKDRGLVSESGPGHRRRPGQNGRMASRDDGRSWVGGD